jgi:dihydroorotate dehydrogenase (NAD+) catalytic subunit
MHVVIAPRTGLALKNPVITASGTFGYGVEFARRMDISGLGCFISKGTTREPRTGNQPVRLTETAAGMLNAIGLQNIGVDAVVRDKAPIWASWTIPVLVNVSGTSIEDYVYVASRLDAVTGVSGIELNISCPNVKDAGTMFATEPRLASEVTRAVREATHLPLIVKLSPNVADIREIAAAVESAGADAVSLVNTFQGMAVDVGRRAPTLSTVSGGVSGPAIKPLALHLVYRVAQEVSIPVIGIGGIMTASDAIEYILAGATAVELATALLVDPTCWLEIVSGIEAWCRREGVRNLADITGVANSGFRGNAAKTKAGELHAAGR